MFGEDGFDIAAGGKLRVPVEGVAARAGVRWQFRLEALTVAFSVELDPANPEASARVLVPAVEYAAGVTHGSVRCPEAGTVWLVWDNYSSWFRAKRVSYSVETLEPAARRRSSATAPGGGPSPPRTTVGTPVGTPGAPMLGRVSLIREVRSPDAAAAGADLPDGCDAAEARWTPVDMQVPFSLTAPSDLGTAVSVRPEVVSLPPAES